VKTGGSIDMHVGSWLERISNEIGREDTKNTKGHKAALPSRGLAQKVEKLFLFVTPFWTKQSDFLCSLTTSCAG
jgi:hypothetical protein